MKGKRGTQLFSRLLHSYAIRRTMWDTHTQTHNNKVWGHTCYFRFSAFSASVKLLFSHYRYYCVYGVIFLVLFAQMTLFPFIFSCHAYMHISCQVISFFSAILCNNVLHHKIIINNLNNNSKTCYDDDDFGARVAWENEISRKKYGYKDIDTHTHTYTHIRRHINTHNEKRPFLKQMAALWRTISD